LCSFCQQSLPSSAALREHLLLCGNKTDECPKCRQLIRRSHFAYHYENNCAPIDQVETPPTGRQSRSTQRPPTNSNTPVARVDVPNDDYRENHLGQSHSMHPQRVNDRIQINLSTYFCFDGQFSLFNVLFALKEIHQRQANVNIVISDMHKVIIKLTGYYFI